MGVPAPLPDLHRQSLANEITTLYAHINAATCRLIELIGAFDELGYYADFGAVSTVHWLTWACGIGSVAAREKVRVARALEHLPAIHAAFRAGRLSYSKVRALTRVASPANEETLVELAAHATAAQTERIMRNYRQALSFERAAEGRHDRALVCQWEGDGTLSIRGRLAPEQGAVFMKALEQALEAVPEPQGEQPWEQQTDYPAEIRRADALVVLAERSLEAGQREATLAERFQVLVHASAEALAAGDEAPATPGGDLPRLHDGPAISAERARRLCCDGSVVPILEGADGAILDVGRKRRTVPPAIRRALERRDGRCRFPGCSHTRNLHAHHLRHWARGGATRLDNLILLCSRHHRLVHEGGYQIRRQRDSVGRFEFFDPHGQAVPLADDLHGGDWQQLVAEVSAETPDLHAGSLIPDLDWRPPDYDHIAWWMVNFMPR